MEKEKIASFQDLKAWQEGHRLVMKIYTSTKEFPKTELFSLTNQIRRAAVSITSNLVEGFSRNTNKDKIQFYTMSLGLLSELQNQIIIARDLKYLNIKKYNEIYNQSIKVSKLINGLIKYHRTIHNT